MHYETNKQKQTVKIEGLEFPPQSLLWRRGDILPEISLAPSNSFMAALRSLGALSASSAIVAGDAGRPFTFPLHATLPILGDATVQDTEVHVRVKSSAIEILFGAISRVATAQPGLLGPGHRLSKVA